MAKKTKVIDDTKMDKIIEKGWADYQKAQKKQAKKSTTTTAKKTVKRK